ncbi:polysaccharide biosynthesis tyrosine autokinase [Enterobacteriaceae bacterium YMB-R22]|uniref:Polysaccharide biosynthesis tyrosine autokinase n=3 Tax=Enterobacteriaceae TaxID=543 RepID=A0A8K0XWK1_9ENTR|nr:polysaccharide biosynthesis tyrosine autokinase [Tenebrionibacter intestinalis]MBV4413744.1 polysaccharide biosynthesis tyrosine autokinase [Tenebrionicola larvae]MBV5095072.1 polysaccharide biosynthesis tyrosine autokinase [Tenebrionicola larvae]
MQQRLTSDSGERELDLGRLLFSLLDHKWLILLTVLASFLLGLVYVSCATPVYRANALIQIDKNSSSMLLSDLSGLLSDKSMQSGAEVEIIKSRMVVGQTVQELGLDLLVREKRLPVIGYALARLFNLQDGDIAVSRLSIGNSFTNSRLLLTVQSPDTYQVKLASNETFEGKVGQVLENAALTLLVSDIRARPGTVFQIEKLQVQTAVESLLQKFTVTDKGKDTGVMQLTYEGPDPVLIRKVLDSISRNYLQQNIDWKSEEAERSLVFVNDQLPKIRASLNEAEDRLNRFRQKNESVDLSLEAKSVLDTMVNVEAGLNELTFKEAEISKLYTREHPAYRALNEKRKTLINERNKLNQRVESMPGTQQEILRLTRDVESTQQVYMQLLNKQQELKISKASTVGHVRIVDNAVTETKPVKPKKALIVVLFVLLGGLLSCSMVLLKMLFNRGVQSASELEECGVNVYANIPLSRGQQFQPRRRLTRFRKAVTTNSELLAVKDPADLAIEALRNVRTSVQFSMINSENNILMISGPTPGIGKTFVSSNLAAVFAQSGQRVLLIDCDMRRGDAHKAFGHSSSPGLSDVLSASRLAEEVIQKTQVEGLDFISRGSKCTTPSELLMHTRFTQLLNEFSPRYDMVLLDSPPILAVGDAAIIGKHAGCSLLVARFEHNSLKEVEVSIRRFMNNGITINGAILNGTVERYSNIYEYGLHHHYSYEDRDMD